MRLRDLFAFMLIRHMIRNPALFLWTLCILLLPIAALLRCAQW